MIQIPGDKTDSKGPAKMMYKCHSPGCKDGIEGKKTVVVAAVMPANTTISTIDDLLTALREGRISEDKVSLLHSQEPHLPFESPCCKKWCEQKPDEYIHIYLASGKDLNKLKEYCGCVQNP